MSNRIKGKKTQEFNQLVYPSLTSNKSWDYSIHVGDRQWLPPPGLQREREREQRSAVLVVVLNQQNVTRQQAAYSKKDHNIDKIALTQLHLKKNAMLHFIRIVWSGFYRGFRYHSECVSYEVKNSNCVWLKRFMCVMYNSNCQARCAKTILVWKLVVFLSQTSTINKIYF